MQLTENFNSSEFDSPDLPSSGANMSLPFVFKLQEARKIANTPFIITSGYRTKKHNAVVGGVTNTAHMVGKAADIACDVSYMRYKILMGLLSVGFSRIGIYSTYIHVDDDKSKPAEVIFVG